MLRALFIIFLLYLGYKILFDFIIPLVITTHKVKKQFNQMREHVQKQSVDTNSAHEQAASTKPFTSTRGADEDYIEYEEVKS